MIDEHKQLLRNLETWRKLGELPRYCSYIPEDLIKILKEQGYTVEKIEEGEFVWKVSYKEKKMGVELKQVSNTHMIYIDGFEAVRIFYDGVLEFMHRTYDKDEAMRIIGHICEVWAKQCRKEDADVS